MLDIFIKIIDVIFPPHESIQQIKNETPETFQSYFSPSKFCDCIVLSDYSNQRVKAAIKANKFHDSDKAAKLLSVLVKQWLDTTQSEPVIFVPIPLSQTRQKERGYNQVRRILEKIPATNFEIIELITKTKDTKSQTSLKRAERLKNTDGVFLFNQQKHAVPNPCRIILIDDVITTGATMQAASKVLAKNLPKDCELICLALAH